MTGLLLALVAAYGVFLLYTALVLGWTGVGPGPAPVGGASQRTRSLQDWMVQAGLGDTRPAELLAVMAVLLVVGAGLGFAVFGGVVPPIAAGVFAASFPVAAARTRRERRRRLSRDAWPRLIEEIRIKSTTVGRSIPQALFEVGRTAPPDLRPAFEAAHREWLLSTDLPRTLAVLKGMLADATADTVCETLLVAHQVGGTEVGRVLTSLVDDRILDLQGRKDAEARQAGARFARRFVLIVPLGMALVGLTIGDGRAAYQTPSGQLLVLVGLGLMGVCWLWAGRIMRLPDEQRVFHE